MRRRPWPKPLSRVAGALRLNAVNGTSATSAAGGLRNRGTAYRVVRQALDEHVTENVDELRASEVARLDALGGRRPHRGRSRDRCVGPGDRCPRGPLAGR